MSAPTFKKWQSDCSKCHVSHLFLEYFNRCWNIFMQLYILTYLCLLFSLLEHQPLHFCFLVTSLNLASFDSTCSPTLAKTHLNEQALTASDVYSIYAIYAFLLMTVWLQPSQNKCNPNDQKPEIKASSPLLKSVATHFALAENWWEQLIFQYCTDQI